MPLPDIKPMLAKPLREIPEGDLIYEPKWDGFRCIAVKMGNTVELQSRNTRPLARYFPEIVDALRDLTEEDVILDGEIMLTPERKFRFADLMLRIHPAESRVERLRSETPAILIVFDLLRLGEDDLMSQPFEQRRLELERVMERVHPTLRLTPSTRDRTVAQQWLDRYLGRGLDGVMAKPAGLTYAPGKRTMFKVKPEVTIDCVVGGVRARHEAGGPQVESLLLGLYDGGELQYIGTANVLPKAYKQRMMELLALLQVPVEDHPWRHGFNISATPLNRLAGAGAGWRPGDALNWLPLDPRLVCEVGHGQVDEGRLRHGARLIGWRPDRDAESCTIDQLEPPGALDLGGLFLQP